MRVAPPRPVDLVLALAAASALIVDGLQRGAAAPVVVVALSVAACLPLAWGHRGPLAALMATTAGLVVCLVTFHPYDGAILVAMIALFNVALLGHRRRSLLVGAIWGAFLVALILVISPHVETGEAAVQFLLAFAALAVGDMVRSRRALLAAEREREERVAHERERESERRVARERLRIARDLHDTVAHALVAINVRAGVAAHLAREADVDGALDDIRAVSAEALDDLRATLGLLRDVGEPAPTAPELDLAAIGGLVDRARVAGLSADADVHLDGSAIPSAVEHAGFRIVQEALTNVMRHAQASRATVTVRVEADDLRIDVVDDGTAARRAGGSATGHGLRGMAERAAALGGDVVAGPRDAGGWRVLARLPLTTGQQP